MKKSYTESTGLTPVDWPSVIEGVRTLLLTDDPKAKASVRSAREASSFWVTCACGAQCDSLPRDPFGVPRDPELFQLGGHFAARWLDLYRTVFYITGLDQFDLLDDLKDTLDKIEARSTAIL